MKMIIDVDNGGRRLYSTFPIKWFPILATDTGFVKVSQYYSPINNTPLNVESGQMFVQAVLLFQVFSEFWTCRFYYFCSKMDRFLAFSPCKTAKTRFFSARFARQFFFGGFIIPSSRSNVWPGGFIEGGGFYY